MIVVECAHEDVPISNLKESGSELVSQELEVPELRHKLRDDIFKSILPIWPCFRITSKAMAEQKEQKESSLEILRHTIE